MRTATYLRFSSENQRDASIRDQLRNVEAYCTRMGWPAPTVYQDQAISGARNDRPGYLTMLAAADSRAIDVLLVDDLTRLSRDSIESAQAIRRLKFAGVRVIGVSDGVDTSRSGHKLEVGLRGLMGELYLDELAAKTHRGLMGQALDGYSAGGLPYGYTSQHDGHGYKRAINEAQAQWVRYVFARYAAGATVRQIADELNRQGVPSARGGTWAHSALYADSKGVGMLGNPIYVGRQVWNRTAWVKDPVTGRRRRTMRPRSEWIIVETPELAIIDADTWHECETRARSQKSNTAAKQRQGKGPGGRGPKYLFSGLLKCGVCGGAFVIQTPTQYGCATHKDRGPSVCTNGLKVKRSTIEAALLAGVKRDLMSEDAYRAFETEARALLKADRPDPALARRRLSTAQKELDNLMTAIKAGIITTTTRAALEEAEQQAAQARDELRAIEHYEPSQILPRAREIYRDLVASLESIDDVASAREALRQIIGDVRLIPENGALTAEMQSAGLAGALQITVVAGAGFEPATFGL
ncbi:MAG: recombinase family protein [Zoogloeaceae bacterium]|nr:recombinase family protein [Zoogloeaceae bacterium]